MKIKTGYVVRKIGNQFIAVPVGSRTRELHGMIALNETGAFLWKLLETEQTTDSLTNMLTNEYEIDAAHAHESVERFLELLTENHVLDNDELLDSKP